MAKNKELTLDVDEMHDLTGCAKNTIYEAIRQGTFPVPYLKIGRRILISRRGLLAMLEAGQGEKTGQERPTG